MSLKAFHVFFILMAILISLAFAAWVFALAPGQVSLGLQTMGAFSGLLAMGLIPYCIYFIRKARHIIV